MYRYLIKNNNFSHSITVISCLIFIFFLSHIFFGDRSVWKIFQLKNQISTYEKQYQVLVANKNKVLLFFVFLCLIFFLVIDPFGKYLN